MGETQKRLNIIKKFYRKLQDEESKVLFEARYKMIITGNRIDYYHTMDSVNEKNGKKYEALWLKKQMEKSGNRYRKVIIFGAGTDGMRAKKVCMHSEIEVFCFCDNDEEKIGTNYCNIPVISRKELLEKYQECIVLIANRYSGSVIYEQLLSEGFPKKNIWTQREVLGMCGCQYFDLPELTLQENEVYIDAGAFDGQSVIDFIDWSKNNYSRIISFEPDNKNAMKCEDIIKEKNIKNIELHRKGTWSRSETLCFDNKGTASSRISNDGNFQIEVCSIDEVLHGEKATFIKMDVEGSELESLKGAKKTIQKYKPKLAICLYHKEEDIFDIPEYLMGIMPCYNFYLRSYCSNEWEFILYAI